MSDRPPLLDIGPDTASPVEITVSDEQDEHDVDVERWMRLATQVLAAEGVGVNSEHGVEMTMLFVDEDAIASLNAQFMGKEGPTDVLSFPIDEEAALPGAIGPRHYDDDGLPVGGEPPVDRRLDDDRFREPGEHDDLDDIPLLLGDIVICPAYAARNASEHASEIHDGSLDDEIALLVVHGILHLLGMDHLVDAEAETMEAREREHLRRFRSAWPR